MNSPLDASLARTRDASRTLALPSAQATGAVLHDIADALVRDQDEILAANRRDKDRMDAADPKYDRLALSRERIAAIAGDMRSVAGLPSPLGRILEERTVQSGLHLQKMTVPLGVVGMIYEARPNVTADAFALCFKAGNACVLKGGSDAAASSEAIVKIIHGVLKTHGIDPHVVLLLATDRDTTAAMLQAHRWIDVLIPRGGEGLIRFVRENATIPVIETGAGIVHTYIDASADLRKARDIVLNAKTRRVSVCNALDTLLVHEKLLKDLPEMLAPLAEKRVEIFADAQACKALHGSYDPELLQKATKEHFGTEFLSLKMSVKTVQNLGEAMEHIHEHGSRHSEAIVAEDMHAIEAFLRGVDAAAVYANASVAFTDGAQFGMGAEIGISTQKLHARGPMGLPELVSYKWIVRGTGQVRP